MYRLTMTLDTGSRITLLTSSPNATIAEYKLKGFRVMGYTIDNEEG